MLKVISSREFKAEKLPEALELYGELLAASRLEPGCISYDLCRSLQDANRLIIVETWQDEAALAAHRETEHFVRLVPGIGELSTSAELLIGEVI